MFNSEPFSFNLNPKTVRWIVTAYALMATLWGLGTEKVLAHLVRHHGADPVIQELLGPVLVALSALFLFWVLRKIANTRGQTYAGLYPGSKAFRRVLPGEGGSRQEREVRLARLLREKETLGDAARAGRIVPWVLEPQSGRVLQVGDSCGEVLGIHGDALLMESGALEGLVERPYRDGYRSALDQALRGGVGSFEAPLWHGGSGQRIWTRWTVELNQGLLRGTTQDISETHELQEQLLQSQKLGYLGTFLVGITHDFNNILMAMLGYNEMLLMDPALTPLQRRSLLVMEKASNRGRALANQLLRFMREEPPDRRSGNLNDVVQEVQALLGAPGASRVPLDLDLDPDLPPTSFDVTQMHQVLMNLAVNARDALGEEGRIVCRTRVRLLADAEGRELGLAAGAFILLEMEDTGSGISQELQERIFTPFFSTKNSGKGSGLGLALVQGIVQAHFGAIFCTSKVGQGTIFHILLPILTQGEGRAAVFKAVWNGR